MNYCPKCRYVFEGFICPNCANRKKIRPVEDEDVVLLAVRPTFEADLLENALKNDGYPYEKIGTLGAGITTKIGSMFETYRFYVKYTDLPACRDILMVLFGTDKP